MARRARIAMVIGVGAIAAVPGLTMLAWEHGSTVLFLGRFPYLVIAGGTIAAAILARRPAWAATFGSAVLGSVVGLGTLVPTQTASATPAGDTLAPKSYVQALPTAYRGLAKFGDADVALLRRGLRAAEEGHPLAAPEGGFLVPRRVSPVRAVDTEWRYFSSPTVTPAVWSTALRLQEGKGSVPIERIWATHRSTAWFAALARLTVLSGGLALLANLAALAARLVWGERR